MKLHITRIHGPKSCSLDIDPYSNESGTDKVVLKCDQCSFKTVNKTKLKKHKKKPHPTASGSPLRKKAKLESHELSQSIVEDIINQIQDSSETEVETDKELKKFETASFEENRIDEQLMDVKLEEKRLSDQNDQKILKKKRALDEEENLAKQKELERNLNILQSQEGPKRKREPSTKSKRKKKNAPSVVKPFGFRQIPHDLKKHFPNDHVNMSMKPDGLCGVSCGSTHILAQPDQGPELRRKISKHMVLHWEYYQNKIKFPYERQVGVKGDIVKFTDPQEFQNFLQTSAADFLWTDTEEILAMCNMFQMTTSIVKVSNNDNDTPNIVQV